MNGPHDPTTTDATSRCKALDKHGFILPLILGVVILASCALKPQLPVVRFLGGGVPQYPPAARAAGIEGYVIVRYGVNMDGSTSDAVAIESEPPGIFDEAALETVHSWRYAVNGKESSGVILLQSRIEFRLEDTSVHRGVKHDDTHEP